MRAVLLTLLLAAACNTDPAAAPSASHTPAPKAAATPSPAAGPADWQGLARMLDGVTAAMSAGDPDAVRPWLADPTSAFGRRWLSRAQHLRDVPLESYRLQLDPSLPDLATRDVRALHGPQTQVVYVVEEYMLAGFDAAPAAEDLFLTVIPGADGRWQVVGDEDAERLGLVSADHLWDHGPVVVTRSGDGVMALHHPGADLGAVVEDVRAAVATVQQRWPLPWDGRVVLVVPADQDELSELLHVTFELTDFVAFATATPTGELGAYELTAPRVLVNPGRFLRRSPAARQQILVHELLHVATREHAGPFMPSWVEEGVAQRLGEGTSTTGMGHLQELVASGGFDGNLPLDSEFVTGGRDRIFLSYQLAFSFFDHLVDSYGAQRVAEFYRELGRGAVGQPGRESWHVDRAAREIFGRSLEELRAAWAARL